MGDMIGIFILVVFVIGVCWIIATERYEKGIEGGYENGYRDAKNGERRKKDRRGQ